MANSQLNVNNINGNLNTGNISTDDFLAIFSTVATLAANNNNSIFSYNNNNNNGSSNQNNKNNNNNISSSSEIKVSNGLFGTDRIIEGVKATSTLNSMTTAATAAAATTTTATTTGAGGGGAVASIIAAATTNNVTLNPPLLTVDGEYTLTNLLEKSLAEVVTTLNPNSINDSFFYLNGNLYNGSIVGLNYNQSNSNTSNVTELHWDGRYPSGYTLTQIVITSIIVTILMIIIVVGNMLVIIAIATEKSLKNIQNWFIASLAVADFFLGLIIMPFSLANELMGYWVFGSWWCDIHSAMDVLLCTASIMNLCLISLDRYWSITKAVDYLKSRTPARAAVMITSVWIMSALICIPPLLGWKVKMPEGPLPKCAVSKQSKFITPSSNSQQQSINY